MRVTERCSLGAGGEGNNTRSSSGSSTGADVVFGTRLQLRLTTGFGVRMPTGKIFIHATL